MKREPVFLSVLLLMTFAIRAIQPDQPIVENYVGRQIPTAMVARNLERGRGFLAPQLDTGPFPNLFLVEPPIYAQVVVLIQPWLGFRREATGRLVSAIATMLGAWGLYGLVRRREGSTVALLALASFAMFPVMIRYGRAFQPDALMVGCVLVGLRGWDEFEATRQYRWLAVGGFVLAIALALKITVVWALIPFVLIVERWPVWVRLVVAVIMLIPALAWYGFAWHALATLGSGGSLASADNANLWLGSVSPSNWLRLSTLANLTRGLVFRSFTSVGFVLAIGGLVTTGRLDRVWRGWALGVGLSIVGFAAKWHHGYYWMVVAPLAAVGVGRGLVKLANSGKCCRVVGWILGLIFFVMCLVQSSSTWRTPVEWQSLQAASRQVALFSKADELVVAPEALLHYSGRRGFRLEFDPVACQRAADEWGHSTRKVDSAWSLTAFYRDLNRRLTDPDRSRILVADVGSADDRGRRAWRDLIRQCPDARIFVDEPGMMIAELR